MEDAALLPQRADVPRWVNTSAARIDRGIGMVTPRLSELVRRLRLSDPTATVHLSDDGTARIVWQHEGAKSVTLLTTEEDISHAVTAMGEDCRDALWPGSTLEEAGLNLLLVPRRGHRHP